MQAVLGARMVVYIPADETARTAMERLAVGDGMDDRFPCRPRHETERVVELVPRHLIDLTFGRV